jgi:hypothetical protein
MTNFKKWDHRRALQVLGASRLLRHFDGDWLAAQNHSQEVTGTPLLVGERQWMQAKAEAEQYMAAFRSSPECDMIAEMAEKVGCDISKPYQSLAPKDKEVWRKLVNSALNNRE